VSTPQQDRAAAHALWPKDRVAVADDGTELAFTVVEPAGEPAGPPVVFMNGWTCPDAYWRRIVPAVVESGHPAVLFDTRGHGQSGLPRPAGCMASNLTVDDVSVERLARDLVAVIEAAGYEQAVLVGHSMGVQAIFEVWRHAPERVAAIVPVAGTFENPVLTFADKPVLDKLFPVGDWLFSRVPFELARPVMGQLHRMPKPVSMRILRALRVANASVVYDDVSPHFAQFSDVNFSVLWRMMSQMRSHSAAGILPSITAPVLLLGGAKDTFTPPSVQRRAHELIPDSELVLFPEGGHLLPVEEAQGVADALVDFLARRLDSGQVEAGQATPGQ
jgi:pimeloyl-ACP methyl ester carboxylesterase